MGMPAFLSDARFDALKSSRRFEMLNDHSRSKAALFLKGKLKK